MAVNSMEYKPSKDFWAGIVKLAAICDANDTDNVTITLTKSTGLKVSIYISFSVEDSDNETD